MFRRLRSLAPAALILGGCLASGSALAHKDITLKLHNDTNGQGVTCTVYKVVANNQGQDVTTQLKRYAVPRSSSPRSYSLQGGNRLRLERDLEDATVRYQYIEDLLEQFAADATENAA